MADLPAPSRRTSRVARVSVVLAGLLAAYTAFGFLAAPSILRGVIVKQATAALHRDVSVAKVRVNPLALSVGVDGLAVKDHDGAAFVGWDSLYVRLAPLRLLAGEVGLAEIRLVRPSVHVGLRPDGTLSFQDLLAPESPSAAAPAAKPQEGLAVSIGRLAVEEAQVAFHDATRRPAFDATLGPLTIRLESFHTKGGGDSPYSFSGTTDAGETFRWTGRVSTQPLRSAGTVAFERIALRRYQPYVQDAAPVDLHDGLLDFETRYDLEWGSARRIVKLGGGKVTVDRLAVGPRGAASPAVKLPRVEVSGIEVDALARDAKVREIALRGGTVRVLRESGGALELARMAPPPSPKPATPPWTWGIDALAISGVDVQVEDLAAPRPVRLVLGDVQLRVEQLRSERGAAWPVALSFLWEGRGRIALKGPVEPLASKGRLEVEVGDLDLLPLAPYLEPALNARLTGARAGAKLTVTFDASGAAPRWDVHGDVRLEGLAVAEKGNDDLLRWSALEVSGIDAASATRRASIRLVRLVEPRVKAYVWEDGKTSIARAFPPPPPAKPAVAGAAPASPPWHTAIGAVEVIRGKAALVDRSVKPAAVLNVTRADAKVTSLSSDPKVRSAADVRLEVEGASPIRIAGTANPLQKDAYTELTVVSQGVDLSPFDPYSGKFLGYGIQKGKLDLDLRYRIVNRSLTAANVVKVNQFTLGTATESPDATNIPVRLALALLQDKDGVILLDVPIEGSLDDPEFHLGKVIWHTLQSLLVKVATSPFRALAALAGGGDQTDLSTVEFAPGTAALLPSAQERLALLAKSLGERPAIALELMGSTDAEQDGRAMRLAAVERSLRRAKAAKLQPPPASADEVTVPPEERARLVRAVHDAAFPAAAPKPADTAAKGAEPAPPPLTPEQMLERLAAAEEVPADAYRSLASERAQRAREALVAAGVDQARLFLTASAERAAEQKGPRVHFTAR